MLSGPTRCLMGRTMPLEVMVSRYAAPSERHGFRRVTTAVALSVRLSGFGVGPTMVLREKVLCRSLSTIHILYNQALVGGLRTNPDPARQIVNLQLNGGT